MTTIRTTLCALGVASVLSGCTLMPRYTRPDAPVPAQFAGTDVSVAPPAAAATADTGNNADTAYIADIGWRQVFTDPTLQQVIALALDNNRDLRVAALNIEVARAQYRVDRAALLPAIDGTGTANNARTPSELAIPGQPQVFRTYSANIGISAYELDLFGRVRSLEGTGIAAIPVHRRGAPQYAYQSGGRSGHRLSDLGGRPAVAAAGAIHPD